MFNLSSLDDCNITGEGCAALASALTSNPEHLRELDLTENKLGSSEVQLLSQLKEDPHYKLLWVYFYYKLLNRLTGLVYV